MITKSPSIAGVIIDSLSQVHFIFMLLFKLMFKRAA